VSEGHESQNSLHKRMLAKKDRKYQYLASFYYIYTMYKNPGGGGHSPPET